jgi:hypothetical protein
LTGVNQKVNVMIQKEILLINLDPRRKSAEILKQKMVLVNGVFGFGSKQNKNTMPHRSLP